MIFVSFAKVKYSAQVLYATNNLIPRDAIINDR